MPERSRGADSCPTLVPLTPEARQSVPGPVPLKVIPFLVGRDLRDGGRSFRLFRRDRRRDRSPGLNRLYLVESSRPHRVSRQHLLIGKEGNRYFVEDCNSACGTLVEGKPLGGQRKGGRRWLQNGDVIIVGGNHSPFVFKFVGPDASGNGSPF